jgi:hypothetical protein
MTVALISNGQLLVLHQNAADAAQMAMTGLLTPFQLMDYRLEPLFPGGRLAAFAATLPSNAPVWSLAKPTTTVQQNPWDVAHHAAAQQSYAAYVEPDIMHAILTPPPAAVAPDKLNPNYPPKDAVSPGWHLDHDHTSFGNIRANATGRGMRIAHLDTGYTPGHVSTPRNIHPEFGWNFWDDNDNTVDPGTQLLGLLQPGHGTATLAILAGNRVDLTFEGQNYVGDFGGAPDADVIPVRIGASVVHLYSSTMARGLNYALAPRNNPRQKCDVISLSHGGLPSAAWATAVNALYDAGVTIVAASGDSFYEGLVDLATRFTVYPSAFNRVITALGATYAREPYKTTTLNVMQGCWGPDAVMKKAVAGFTPNIAWMNRTSLPAGFDMTGGGTSASTPQIAAACALWLQLYSNRFPADWHVVEACRLALFRSSMPTAAGQALLGWGTLNVQRMLDGALADAITAEYHAGTWQKSAMDEVSFAFWRELLGAPPPGSAQEAMYETEVAQIVLSSRNAALVAAAQYVGNGGTLDPSARSAAIDALRAEPISAALTSRLHDL